MVSSVDDKQPIRRHGNGLGMAKAAGLVAMATKRQYVLAGRGQFLDAVVLTICHKDLVTTVASQTYWHVELPRPRSKLAYSSLDQPGMRTDTCESIYWQKSSFIEPLPSHSITHTLSLPHSLSSPTRSLLPLPPSLPPSLSIYLSLSLSLSLTFHRW